MSAKNDKIYKVLFLNQGKVYELYARDVYQGSLYGFVEVEELLFGNKTTLLVDPAEERLRNEFLDVKRTFIPMHSIIRIDEVEKQGASKVRGSGEPGDNVAHLSFYNSPKNGGPSGKKD